MARGGLWFAVGLLGASFLLVTPAVEPARVRLRAELLPPGTGEALRLQLVFTRLERTPTGGLIPRESVTRQVASDPARPEGASVPIEVELLLGAEYRLDVTALVGAQDETIVTERYLFGYPEIAKRGQEKALSIGSGKVALLLRRAAPDEAFKNVLQVLQGDSGTHRIALLTTTEGGVAP